VLEGGLAREPESLRHHASLDGPVLATQDATGALRSSAVANPIYRLPKAVRNGSDHRPGRAPPSKLRKPLGSKVGNFR
jgi:hypothetical protein